MMSKRILFLCLLTFAYVSCQNNGPDHKAAKTGNIVHSGKDTIQEKAEIISSILIDSGDTLRQKFNNGDRTCKLELDGEKIELRQQRMASGIKYSNDHFVYTNWHGQTRLYKDGKLIFSHDLSR